MSNTHTYNRQPRVKNHNKLSNKAMAVGLAAAALAVGGHLTKERIDAGASKQEARTSIETVNVPQRVVSLDADTTVFGVASLAVEKGYLDTDVRDASNFLTKELETQMHASGQLAEDENLDLGSIQPGTKLRIPAAWESIGEPEDKQIEIGTAITGEYDPATGKTMLVETDQAGQTATTVEP